MKDKRKVIIEEVYYDHPPSDPTTVASKKYEEFVYPWYPRCTNCKKSMGSTDIEYSDIFCFPVTSPAETMQWSFNIATDFERNAFNPNSLENLIEDFFEQTVIVKQEYNKLFDKTSEKRTQGFKPHMCITCFRQLTEQTHTWYDIPLPTNKEKVEYKEKKVIYPKGHPKA